MRPLAYTVHDAHGGGLLTSATAALVLWAALIASNLWWLHQAGAFELPAVVRPAWRAEAANVPAMRLARQRALKLDADGNF